tara:strand:- start:30586 stop:30831 length:246 start_codon:yes stop_codon:yes gene_type:complete
MLFTNKEEFKDNKKVYTILTALEKAHTNKDSFSASILLTRLKALNITLETSNVNENNRSETTEKQTLSRSSGENPKEECHQ